MMDNNQLDDDSQSSSSYWASPKIQLSHLIATISLSVSALWFIADMKKDIELLKQHISITQVGVDNAQDKYLAQSLKQLEDKLNRMDDKLDRLIEGKKNGN